MQFDRLISNLFPADVPDSIPSGSSCLSLWCTRTLTAWSPETGGKRVTLTHGCG